MRLYEFQAKRILAEHGIPVPRSVLLSHPADVDQLVYPIVLKAQVLVGGRGKTGGIRMADNRDQAAHLVGELLGSEIRGHPVQAVLAEAKAEILREHYLSILLDPRSNRPLVMASAVGGVDIEQVAREDPRQVTRAYLDPLLGLPQFTIRSLAKALGVLDLGGFGAILGRMYDILWTCDAILVEINPLAETPQGLMALDAKMVLDDKAAYRQADLVQALAGEQKQLDRTPKTEAQKLAEARDITYVLLDGDIGLISDGAGTGMLTLDLIQDARGRPANFCELGGLANAERMCQAIEVVLANPRVKALLITLIGGLTRMDEMAEGIARYLGKTKSSIPMVVRMCGTQEEAGKAILSQVGLEPFFDLPAAVQATVSLAQVEN